MLALSALCVLLQAQTVGTKLEPEAGLYVDLDNSQKMNLRLVENQVRIYFTDAEGLLIQPPFKRAVVNLQEMRDKDNKYHLMLEKEPGQPWLTHPRLLYPPYHYRARIVLYRDETQENLVTLPMQIFEQP